MYEGENKQGASSGMNGLQDGSLLFLRVAAFSIGCAPGAKGSPWARVSQSALSNFLIVRIDMRSKKRKKRNTLNTKINMELYLEVISIKLGHY